MVNRRGGKWAVWGFAMCLWSCGGNLPPHPVPSVRAPGGLLMAVLDRIEQSHVNPIELSVINMLRAGCGGISRRISGGDVLVRQQQEHLEISFRWNSQEVRTQLRWRDGDERKRKHFLMEGFRAVTGALRKVTAPSEALWEEAFARGLVESIDSYSRIMNPSEAKGYLAGLSPQSQRVVEKQAWGTGGATPVGYLKVKNFARGVAQEVGSVLCSDEGRNFAAWVLDLRDNLGGYVDESQHFLGFWVREKTAFWMGSRRGVERVDVTPARDCFSAGPLVVLVNHNTASSAELVAGVLQQERRALVFGEHTYGKGYVQRTFSLPQGFDLLLTTEKWFLPGPTLLPATGWVPDVVWKNTIEDDASSPSWVAWPRSTGASPARCATLRIGGSQPVTRALCPREDGTRAGPDLERQAAGVLAQLLTEEIGLQEQAVAARIANKNSTTPKTKV